MRQQWQISGEGDWQKSQVVNFQFVVQLILVLICLRMSCTTTTKIDELETFASDWRGQRSVRLIERHEKGKRCACTRAPLNCN